MVTVEILLDSAVSPSRTKMQATIKIWNIGGTSTRGNYGYEIRGKKGKKLHTGTVHDFPRKQKLALDLVSRVLTDARGVQ